MSPVAKELLALDRRLLETVLGVAIAFLVLAISEALSPGRSSGT